MSFGVALRSIYCDAGSSWFLESACDSLGNRGVVDILCWWSLLGETRHFLGGAGGGGWCHTLCFFFKKKSVSEDSQCFFNHGGRSPKLCYETYILDLFGCSYLVATFCEMFYGKKWNSLVFWRWFNHRQIHVFTSFLEFPRSLRTTYMTVF